MYLHPRTLFRQLFLALLTLWISALWFTPHAFADTDPIAITAQTSTLDFPKAIDFQVSAHDAQNPMGLATLYLKYDKHQSYSEIHVVTQTKGNDVTFKWHEVFDDEHFSPVGTSISYYWIVNDTAGNSHTSAIKSLQINDNRFQWQHLSQGLYQVNWYNRPTDFGQIVLSQITNNLKRIHTNLGVNLNQPINLWVYETTDDFHSSLPPKTVEWVGGIAFYTLNQAEIAVSGADDITLSRDLPHELTHLVLHQTARQDVPTWFDEGLAVYNQTYHEPTMQLEFKDMIAQHKLMPLTSLESSFPHDSAKAYQAYTQSWKLVDYMYTNFGQNKMSALIQSTHNIVNTFDVDLQQSIGMDTRHLENQWHIQLNQAATITGKDPSTQPTPPIVHEQPSLTDPTGPYLIVAGSLLIILPIICCLILLIYVLNRRRKARIVTQPFYNPITPFPYNPAQPFPGMMPDNRQSYTNPTAYAPPSSYPQMEHPTTSQNGFPPLQTAYPPYPWAGQPTEQGPGGPYKAPQE